TTPEWLFAKLRFTTAALHSDIPSPYLKMNSGLLAISLWIKSNLFRLKLPRKSLKTDGTQVWFSRGPLVNDRGQEGAYKERCPPDPVLWMDKTCSMVSLRCASGASFWARTSSAAATVLSWACRSFCLLS